MPSVDTRTARLALFRGTAVLALATVLLFLAAACFIAAGIAGPPHAARAILALGGVIVLVAGARTARRGWRLLYHLGRPRPRRHPGSPKPSFRSGFAAATLLADVGPALLRCYAVIIAGPLLLLAMAIGVLIDSAATGTFGGLALWAVVPLQLLPLVGVTIAGTRLRAGWSGQLRFGSYAAAVVPVALGIFVTATFSDRWSQAAVIGLVGAGCLAWVIGTDLAGGHFTRTERRS